MAVEHLGQAKSKLIPCVRFDVGVHFAPLRVHALKNSVVREETQRSCDANDGKKEKSSEHMTCEESLDGMMPEAFGVR
jgi:hypothetical protein